MESFQNVWEKWMNAKEWWGYEIALVVLADAFKEEFVILFNDVMRMNCGRCRSLYIQMDGE